MQNLPGRFELVSDYRPQGDQPAAIEQLVDGVDSGLRHQTLLGVTYRVRRLRWRTSLPS
ncbi:hypothetical protein GCM10025858_23510 [Alicyclobacillus sacchari]|nr:hypothetical protein GCM10025858_23510 [Alicyclobacillus sacchari]